MLRNIALLLPVLAIAALLYGRIPGTTSEASEGTFPALAAGSSRLLTEFGTPREGEVLEAYRTWSRKPAHFGAFAVSEFGVYGWVSNYNDMSHAEASALAFCGYPDCRIVARSLPLESVDDDVRVISSITMHLYFDYLQERGSKAFAAAPNGASGWMTNASTPAEARRKALGACRAHLTGGTIPEGLDQPDCEIIHVARN